MKQRQVNSIFLNVGHFLDHFVMLIFASVAALSLTSEWSMSYSELIPYATLGFMAFGACALIAGWVADKWSRKGMLFIFFLGIGFSSLLSGLSNDPNQLAIGLLLIGIFASIYHPVGLAMVVEGRDKTGIPLAINGVFGNMGVASSALITGILIDNYGWRSAFFIPGIIATCIGFLYLVHIWHDQKRSKRENTTKKPVTNDQNNLSKSIIIKAFGIIFFSTAMGGFIFQSTTFSLPKMIDELLNESATMIGWYSFIIFSIAALAQLIVGHLVDRHSVKLVFSTVAFMQFLLFMLMMALKWIRLGEMQSHPYVGIICLTINYF